MQIKVSRPEPGRIVMETEGKEPATLLCTSPADYQAVHAAIAVVNGWLDAPPAEPTPAPKGKSHPPFVRGEDPKGGL